MGKRSTIPEPFNLLDAMPVAIIGIEKTGDISYVNPAAYTEFGFSEESLLGRPFTEIFVNTSLNKTDLTGLLNDKEFTKSIRNQTRRIEVRSCSLPLATGKTTFVFIRDISRYYKRETLFLYLTDAAAALSRTRDTDTALTQIADFIVPSFANWFTVDLIRDEKLQLILLKHEDPAKIEWAYQYRKNYPADLNSNTGAAAVAKTGEPRFIPVVTEDMIDMSMADPVQRAEVKKIGIYSVIIAPVRTNNQVTGLVNFISSRPERHFDEEDLDFALHFANLIGLALETTRLNEEAARELGLRKEGEERFRFLLDAIPHKMWTSAPDGRATYYNRQWYDYTGIQGFENLREKIWGLIHPDDLADAAIQWPEAIKSGKDMEMEHRLRQFDGNFRWHLSRFRAYRNEQDEVTLWVGTSTDVHDQKKYELELAAANEEITATNEELLAANEELEAANETQVATNKELRQAQGELQQSIRELQSSRQRFQTFLDSIPQIAWASASGSEVDYYNRRWYEYTGLTFDETRNLGWKRVIHPDDLDYTMGRLSAITQDILPGEFEVRERRNDGTYRWHLVRITPLLADNGKPEQWIGTATDIEDLKILQQKKDDFISIASHELKTPLTSLKATIQLLYRMKENVAPEKFPLLIEQASRNMHKMTSLVDELLNVNRVKENLSLQKEWFILSELVNACCNHITVAGKHNVSILGDKTLKVFADETAIDQVIVNFVNNAVKYAPGSKDIVVNIDQSADKVKLTVSDQGPGIPAAQLPFVFDRYYQAGKQDYRNPGLGLGLYISAEIIKRHGGDIGADSEPGKGASFWFTLPANA